MTTNAIQFSPVANENIAILDNTRLSSLVSPDVFTRMRESAAHLIGNNEKLRQCDPQSVLGALYTAATNKFRIEPHFGECFLIPRTLRVGNQSVLTCQFQIGYKGWKAIALQSGNVAFMQAHGVYKEDVFEHQYGTGSFLRHIRAQAHGKEYAWFYALAKLQNGMELFELVSASEAEKNRRHSETQYTWSNIGGKNQKVYSEKPVGIWAEHYEAMALRVAIKKLVSALPMTDVIDEKISLDGAVSYLQQDGTLTTITPADVENSAEKMDNSITLHPDWISEIEACQTKEEMNTLFLKYKAQHEKEQIDKNTFAQVAQMIVKIGQQKGFKK